MPIGAWWGRLQKPICFYLLRACRGPHEDDDQSAADADPDPDADADDDAAACSVFQAFLVQTLTSRTTQARAAQQQTRF
jgi:hypothetical protein